MLKSGFAWFVVRTSISSSEEQASLLPSFQATERTVRRYDLFRLPCRVGVVDVSSQHRSSIPVRVTSSKFESEKVRKDKVKIRFVTKS